MRTPFSPSSPKEFLQGNIGSILAHCRLTRISYKVHDGSNYSESSNHIFINVDEENLTASSSKALSASQYSSGMSYRLLGQTTGIAEIDRLMSGAGWAQSDGEYGSNSEIYLTYSFYSAGSGYSYLTD